MQHLTEFNKGSLIIDPEYGDFAQIKKNYGSHMAIVGGLPLSVLNYQSKEECCDYAKKLIDDCAPNGGYMLSTDKGACYANDLNVENFKAVVETVNEYGRY